MHEPTQPPPREPSIKSGFDAFVQKLSNAMLREQSDLQDRINQLTELYHPANTQETYYLNQLAEAQVEMERLGRLQSGLFSVFIHEAIDHGHNQTESFHELLLPDTDMHCEQRRNLVLAKGFVEVAKMPNILAFFNRLNTQAERRLRHAQEQFDRIRRQNLKPPVEPAAPQPESETAPKPDPFSSEPIRGPKVLAPKPTQSPRSEPARKPPSASQGRARSPDKRSRPG